MSSAKKPLFIEELLFAGGGQLKHADGVCQLPTGRASSSHSAGLQRETAAFAQTASWPGTALPPERTFPPGIRTYLLLLDTSSRMVSGYQYWCMYFHRFHCGTSSQCCLLISDLCGTLSLTFLCKRSIRTLAQSFFLEGFLLANELILFFFFF